MFSLVWRKSKIDLYWSGWYNTAYTTLFLTLQVDTPLKLKSFNKLYWLTIKTRRYPTYNHPCGNKVNEGIQVSTIEL